MNFVAPYQTYGQSCKALSCNSAQGLVCGSASLCVCPSSNSYWSRNETGCRMFTLKQISIHGKKPILSRSLSKKLVYDKRKMSFRFSIFFKLDRFICILSIVYCSVINIFNNKTISNFQHIQSSSVSFIKDELLHRSNRTTKSFEFVYFCKIVFFLCWSLISDQWQWVDGNLLSSSSLFDLFCANGTINRFDPILLSDMNCGIYRMDSCLARHACQRTDVNFICEKSRNKY